jgi:Leucine-rich repeat (LRR) protein
VSAADVSFVNVTVEWKLEGSAETVTIESSRNLKENAPNVSSAWMSATLTGFVPVLYEDSVSDVDNLTSLVLSNVGLKEVKPGAFGSLPQLRYLILSHNDLREVSEGTFANLNLSTLNLAYNSISSVRAGAFRNLQIQHLTLAGNKIVRAFQRDF